MRYIPLFAVPVLSSIPAVLASPQASPQAPKSIECLPVSGGATSTLAARCTPSSFPPLARSSQSPENSRKNSKQELSLPQQLFLAQSAADRFDLLPDDSQFVFNFNQTQEGAGDGGMLVVANRKTFPALIGTGSGMAVGRVGPCGLNTFHTHPRSAELQLVVEGRLVTEMMPENGIVNSEGKPRVIKNEIGAYQMTPFYQGSVHTQFNPDCSDAVFVAAFSSEDPGAGQVVEQTVAFTDDLIAAALGQSISGENIEAVRKAIPTSIALGVESCLQRCGIEKKSM